MSDPSPPQSDTSPLPFTGERFTPECVREIWYEHWHRYALVAPLCAGKRVLDVACGEGYGSHLLAAGAQSVLGLDIDVQAVTHATHRYVSAENSNRLRYQVGDCAQLPVADASVDVVVSFETLEHIHAQADMLAECRRVLTPEGVLVISTPDREVYQDVMGSDNEFHVRELTRGEFLDLLHKEFPATRLLGQKLLFVSAIWDEDQESPGWALAATRAGQLEGRSPRPWPAVYHVAFCAAQPSLLPDTPGLHVFGDLEESVYRHYNDEVGKSIRAGLLLAERDQTIEALREELAALKAEPGQVTQTEPASAPKPWWRRLFS